MSVSNQPRVLLVAEPNGTGKTTITERGLAHAWFQDCEYINPNVIARDKFGDWNDPVAIRQAADWAAMRRAQCLEQHQSLAFESVFPLTTK